MGSDALNALYDAVEEDTASKGCAAQVALARGGELLGTRTFGDAPAGDATLFSIFSVTKAFTSAVAWLLLADGELSLGDRAADLIPEFGSHGKGIVTVEQLLTHTAGFPNAVLPTHDWPDPARRLEHFASWPLEWEPGSRFVYHGGSTMWVLAELITHVAGRDYRAFQRERIFEPLGLADLHNGLPDEAAARVADVRVVGEEPTEAERAVSPVDAPMIGDETLAHANRAEDRAIGHPGGGIIATAADVARFYQALLEDEAGEPKGRERLWPAALLRDAWTPRHAEFIDPMTGHPALRGLGVVVAGEEGKLWRGFAETCSPRAFGHMGAGGQISWADPETGIVFVYLTNGAERDPARQGLRGFRLSTLAAACA